MLTADTTLEIWTSATTLLDSHLHQLTNTCLVENLEWVQHSESLLQVNWQEAGNVVTAVAECHLSQVVSTETEVLSLLAI